MTPLTSLIPLRRLSQSLIIILILISPLSFSSDKISNFTYECPMTDGCTVRQRRHTAILETTPVPPRQQSLARVADHALPLPCNPPRIRISCAASSRAPPA